MNNKFYDIILKDFKKYNDYNTYFEKEKESAKDKRKKIMESMMASEEEVKVIPDSIKEQMFDLAIKERIYSSDLQYLYHNLYTLVKAYQQLDDTMVLPKDVVELCEQYEHITPKTVFVVTDKGAEEREKGSLDKIKESWKKSGAQEFAQKQIDEELNNAPQE